MRQGNVRSRLGQAEAGVSSYLACWHVAFAARKADPGPLVELWFDRGEAAPLCERVWLPRRLDAHALRMAALYLAALINNKLCVWGARRVSLVTDEANLGKELLRRVSSLLLYRAESFSDLTLLFLFALIEQCHGERLVLDTDRGQAERLSALVTAPAVPPVPPQPPDRHTVVAVNIGQHKTAWGLVCLDGAGGSALSRTGRRETWPEAGSHCLPQLADTLLGAVEQALGQLPPETGAVCLSLANPVVGGRARGVSQIGMCASCDPEVAADLDQALRRAVAAHFPGLPFFLVNDAAAQGLFTSRHGGGGVTPEEPGAATQLLSVRFGACPSVSYIDATGRNLDRLNEYPRLVTTVHANRNDKALFATISRYLSFYGFGSIAGELGLLDKYGLEQNAAAAFFYGLYNEGDEDQWRDAVKIYRILGAHIAMLAYEVQRDTPVSRVTLLGSRANHLDAMVFGPIWDGFAGFIDRHGLPFDGLEFNLIEEASTKAGLVGAAIAYADAKRTGLPGQVGPETS